MLIPLFHCYVLNCYKNHKIVLVQQVLWRSSSSALLSAWIQLCQILQVLSNSVLNIFRDDESINCPGSYGFLYFPLPTATPLLVSKHNFPLSSSSHPATLGRVFPFRLHSVKKYLKAVIGPAISLLFMAEQPLFVQFLLPRVLGFQLPWQPFYIDCSMSISILHWETQKQSPSYGISQVLIKEETWNHLGWKRR